MEKNQMQEFKKKYGNKDTLIKIFIEALEANPILEKFMSIEQIKNKLNSVIYSVEFISDYSSIINIDNVNKSTMARWDTKNGIILFYDKNIDINNDTEIKMTIIHELFHALSTSFAEYISLNPSTKAELKCGVRFAKFFSFLNENKEDQSWNDGLNEGITQWLTEMVMEQYSFKSAYRTETDYIFPKLCNIIDIDEILRLYFEDIKNIDPNAQKELFKNYLITKFGTIGTSISNQVTKILELTDFVTNYSKQDKLNEDSKKCKQKSLTEIDNSFSKIFSIIIENEHDLLMKIKKIGEYKKLTTGSTVIEEAKKILENISKSETNESNIIGILNELVNIGIKNVTTNFLLESNISDEKKFELLKEWNFNSTLFEKIAKCNFIASMPASDQLEFFLKNNLDDKIEDNNAADTIYQLCVKDNIIVDQVFKKNILFDYYNKNKIPTNIENLKKDLEKIKYKKIGDYYFADNTDWCYDESGNKLALNEIDYSFIREFVDIEDKNEQVKEVLPNTDWNELEKIRNSCVNEFKKEYNTKKLSTHIYGINNLCIVCTSYKEVTVYNYYKVDENGKMIKMEPRN